MKSNVGHIKNPLTVISQFAAIAEISGTIVLPFIAPENQAIYIWFLMLFPVFLVGIFFLTLNFNHKTLYAPSDYSNQDHFLNLFGIVTTTERDEKLIAEVEETEGPAYAEHVDPTPPACPEPTVEDVSKPEPESGTTANEESSKVELGDKLTEQMFDLEGLAKKSNIEQLAKLEYIEKRSIEKLKNATKVNFSAKVKFEIPGRKKPIIFDAVADQGETIHIAEVKYFPDNRFTPTRFRATLENAYAASQTITNVSNRKIQLHLVVVLNQPTSKAGEQDIKSALTNAALSLALDCKVYVTSAGYLSTGLVPSSWVWNN
ncbi:DUF697 domain-containing protein [Pseudomonas marginalis]